MKKTIGFPYTLLGFFCIIISCSHLRILRLRTITFVTQQYIADGYIIYLLLISLKYKFIGYLVKWELPIIKRMQRRGERVRIMSREIGSYTKSIEQTEYDVSTSSKSTLTTQEKETEESAINVSFVSTPSTQGASSSTSASKIDFLLLPPWIIMLRVLLVTIPKRHRIWTPPVCT